MDNTAKRGALEGIGFGLIAGVIMAVAFVIVEAAMGNPPLTPFRLIASVAYGESALTTRSLGACLAMGSLIHFSLSAIFGLIYGLINSSLSADLQTSWGKQTAIGVGYGAVLWLVNFQLIARWRFPWLLDRQQFVMLLVHALAFGLPLALMYVASERRAHHLPTGGVPSRPA